MENIRTMAIEASNHAYSPYSKVRVGAVVETQDGTTYSGCNIENASFGGTVCAERVAIWKAVSEGHKNFKKIYVYTKDGWPPCGMCLQVMAEFAHQDFEIIMGNESGQESLKTLDELLTHAFTPKFME